MDPKLVFGLVAVVLAYYIAVWLLVGRDPKPGTIVAQYAPPENMSAATLRFCWKQRFDERVLWAGVLGLVAKGLAKLESADGATRVEALQVRADMVDLPAEEAVLYRNLLARNSGKRRGVNMSLADDAIIPLSVEMAHSLRKVGAGRWFRENRTTVVAGAILSLVAVALTVRPNTNDSVMALFISLGAMTLPTFYLYFLLQRFPELVSVCRKYPSRELWKRLLLVTFLTVCCVFGMVLGSVVLSGNFGALPVVEVIALVTINVLFLHLMKAPTRAGRKLMDHIAGFREFLQMVEHLPMNWPDAPADYTELYRRYLPYALALDVEQQWCDKFSALASGRDVADISMTIYYLGMWDGKPIRVAYSQES